MRLHTPISAAAYKNAHMFFPLCRTILRKSVNDLVENAWISIFLIKIWE